MKKMITTFVAVAALLVTSAQADFDFGEMFEDMKEAALTMTKDSQDKTAHVAADPKTTEDASTHSWETAYSIPTDMKDSQDANKGSAKK